jgi:hypothetical protein
VSVNRKQLTLRAAPRLRAGTPSWPGPAAAAFGIALAGALAVALAQGPKPFYYDSGVYWGLARSFVVDGHFSLQNFNSPLRGYVLPLIDYGLQTAIVEGLRWSPSAVVKLLNVLLFALIGGVLAPGLAEVAWPRWHWGLWRRVALMSLLIVFWSGYLNFPLSDVPALTMGLAALVAVSRPDRPSWMLAAGILGAIAGNMRPEYLVLTPVLIALVAWSWFEQRGERHATVARRALCGGLLIVGFAAVSLPQSLASHRHFDTWSFVSGSESNLKDQLLTEGLLYRGSHTYVGPDGLPKIVYLDATGARLLAAQKNHTIASLGQYVGLIVTHPLAMGGVLFRHLVNGLDPRYSTPYVERLTSGWQLWRRLAGFLLVFLALVRVLWPAARRSLTPGRWRYVVGLLACCVPSLTAGVEPRYLLPIYLTCYILVLAPGWPSPLGSAAVGLRRLRTPAILLAACLVFMVVVWSAVDGATRQVV